VSVCVVSAGRPELADLLDSLSKQDVAPAEVLVLVDDDVDLAKGTEASHPGVHVGVFSGLTLGAARNRLVERASGDLLVFLDDDSVAPPEFVANLIDLAAASPDVGIFGGPNLTLAEVDRREALVGELLASRLVTGPFARRFRISLVDREDLEGLVLCNLAVRRSVWKPFVESLPEGEETEFLHRLSSDGVEVLASRDLTPDIVGTEGDDVLDGGSGSQVIFGLGGNDVIDAGSGSDIVCGGDGDDQIIGGSGVDELMGGSGNDTIDAGPGLDTIYAGPGADVVDGGGGADTIFGWGGDDILNGGTGADEIDGEAGVDTIDGGTGSDTCETEPTRVNCEHDLESTGGGGETPAEETVISRTYDGDSLLTSVTVTHPDGTVDTYELTWDRTLPIPQIIKVDLNGDTTSLVYGVNRAFGVDASGTSGYEYSILGDTASGPLALGETFDPYGQPITPEPTTIGFGYRGELHAGTHVYLRFRDLDPAIGRFTTHDPLTGLAGSPTVTNQYAYAGNDPAGLVDSLGLRASDSDFVIEPGSPTDPIGSSTPSWLLTLAEQLANEVTAGSFFNTVGVCGDITLDAIFSVQFQGCLVDDGSVLGGAFLPLGGVGGGAPPFVAGSENLSRLFSNALSIQDLEGDTACVGLGAGEGLVLGVEVCLALRAGTLTSESTRAEFDRLWTGVYSVNLSVGFGGGAPVVGRFVVGNTRIEEFWDYPDWIPGHLLNNPLLGLPGLIGFVSDAAR